MKKELLCLTLAAATTMAAAPQILVQGRTDYRYDMRNAADDALRDNNGFNVPYARLDVKGKANDDLSYRMRLRFDFASQSVSGTKALVNDSVKGVASYIDNLYATQKFSHGFSVTAGKFFSGRAGWEGLASGMDHYHTTLVYSATAGDYQSVLGVQPQWEGANQTVQLTVANSGQAWTSDKGVQHFLMVGGLWKGNFLNGAIQPNLSIYYRSINHWGDCQTLGTVGLRSEVGIFSGELEWKEFSDTNTISGSDYQPLMQSYSALAKLNFGMLRPQLKVSYDHSDAVQEAGRLDRVAVSPVLEVYPFEKTNFRWHVGYTMLDVMPDQGDSKVYNRIFAGVAINLDVMK